MAMRDQESHEDTFLSEKKENQTENGQTYNDIQNQVKTLPAGVATFSAGAGGAGEGFGAGADGFFSSGGDTLGTQDAKITTKTPKSETRT